ncbi:hypothetical protein EV363DRAFT_1463237 [Boletus edulis]|nr:hypothetical protein EV363DRAFT_1463237 [Boletus edulis]
MAIPLNLGPEASTRLDRGKASKVEERATALAETEIDETRMLDDAHDNALNQAVVISATSAAKISVRDGWTGVMDKLGTTRKFPHPRTLTSRKPRSTTQDQVGTSNDDSDAVPTLKSYWLCASTQPCDGTAIAAVSLSPGSELVWWFRRLPTPPVIQGTPPPLNIYMPSTDTWTTVYPTPDLEHGLVPL